MDASCGMYSRFGLVTGCLSRVTGRKSHLFLEGLFLYDVSVDLTVNKKKILRPGLPRWYLINIVGPTLQGSYQIISNSIKRTEGAR